MPRGPRLDAPGCVQHVMLRGVARRLIFHDDRDRRDLFGRLERILAESGMACFAWAFMPNHLHLVVQTGPVPLARVMARLGTGYAQAFNRRHDRVGHLFQNRYKSILVDDEAQLLALVRYVHLNPLEAALVPSLDALARYPWTGHAALLGNLVAPFQDTSSVLAHFGREGREARRHLLAWMQRDPEPAAEGSASSTRGDAEQRRPPVDGPDRLRDLIACVCALRGLHAGELRSSGRSRAVADARAEIAWRAAVQLGLPGAVVARELGLSEATLSRARNRGRTLIAEDSPRPSGDE